MQARITAAVSSTYPALVLSLCLKQTMFCYASAPPCVSVLSSRLPHRLTCIYKIIQLFFPLDSFIWRKQTNKQRVPEVKLKVTKSRNTRTTCFYAYFVSGTFDLKHKSVPGCRRHSFKHILKKRIWAHICHVMWMLSAVLGFPQRKTTNNCLFSFWLFRAFSSPFSVWLPHWTESPLHSPWIKTGAKELQPCPRPHRADYS